MLSKGGIEDIGAIFGGEVNGDDPVGEDDADFCRVEEGWWCCCCRWFSAEGNEVGLRALARAVKSVMLVKNGDCSSCCVFVVVRERVEAAAFDDDALEAEEAEEAMEVLEAALSISACG